MPHSKNQFTVAMAIVASMLKISKEIDLGLVIVKIRDEPTYFHKVEPKPDSNPWFHDIRMFLKDDNYLNLVNSTNKMTLRKLVHHFFLDGDPCTKDHKMAYYYDLLMPRRQTR